MMTDSSYVRRLYYVKYLLNIYCLWAVDLGTGDTAVSKTGFILANHAYRCKRYIYRIFWGIWYEYDNIKLAAPSFVPWTLTKDEEWEIKKSPYFLAEWKLWTPKFVKWIDKAMAIKEKGWHAGGSRERQGREVNQQLSKRASRIKFLWCVARKVCIT